VTLSIAIIRHDEREEKGLGVTRQILKTAELCDFGRAGGLAKDYVIRRITWQKTCEQRIIDHGFSRA